MSATLRASRGLQAGDRVAVFQSPKRTVVLAAPVHAESTRHKRGHQAPG